MPLTDPNPSWSRDVIARLQEAMSDDLLKPEWRGGPTRTAGHCYAASEALFHALGRQAQGWKSMTMRFGAGTHWFLKHESGVVLDPTWDQFGVPVPYGQARGAGFLTVKPSRRAQTMLTRAGLAADALVGLMPAGDDALAIDRPGTTVVVPRPAGTDGPRRSRRARLA